MSNDSIRDDWPFGPELKRRREHAGLSQRAASRRTTPIGGTKPVISTGRWPQLETGWQKNKAARIPIGTTPATVAAAARAVGWDINDALQLAGFSSAAVAAEFSGAGTLAAAVDLTSVPNEALLDEIRQRMRGEVNVVDQTKTPGASGKAGEAEEVSVHPSGRDHGQIGPGTWGNDWEAGAVEPPRVRDDEDGDQTGELGSS